VRVVVWNLRSGTDAKWDVLQGLGPDIAVLPEAARAPRRAAPSLLGPGVEWHWVGNHEAKGLAVASFGRPSVVAPVEVTGRWSVGARLDGLFVLGIWSCPSGGGYGREVMRALDAYQRRLRRGPAVVAGDFNIDPSGSEERRGAWFSRLLQRFGRLGLHSAYHVHLGEPFGAETRPTYFHYRHRERPFHIDFCFVSEALLERVRHVEVGLYDDWVGAGLSDHVPVIVDIED
jgi:hypothetical protein